MSDKTRHILVTTALTYANGDLHLGHIIEQIQADIWVRFQKMQGHNCLLVSGDDAHGTAIMLSAKKQGLSPESMIAAVHASHQQDAKDFLIDFDAYYTTHSPENQALANLIYEKLQAKGDISKKTIKQAYDEIAGMFLPDRFINGSCPRCQAPEQHGDSCEACGATYSPTDLKEARSVLTGTRPVYRDSLHYFFRLDKYQSELNTWLTKGQLQDPVVKKLKEWFKEGLKPWNISRDAPYFGFEIPNAPNKYFYVWLDAPIGYMAAFQQLCKTRPTLSFDDYWKPNSSTELIHFIGKDIIYFHALFWPAILKSAGFRLPNSIHAHGFLTVNGKKMSKSRGTFITARHYLHHLDPEYLRYYFATKLTHSPEDINLNTDDFTKRVNADLVGKFVNIASRTASFIEKGFQGRLADSLSEPSLFDKLAKAGDTIAAYYEHRQYQEAIKTIMQLAGEVNRYIEAQKPWSIAKHNPKDPAILHACSMSINLFKQLTVYLKPILPNTAEQIEAFLNLPALTWEDSSKPLLSHTIHPFKSLIQRIDPKAMTGLLTE